MLYSFLASINRYCLNEVIINYTLQCIVLNNYILHCIDSRGYLTKSQEETHKGRKGKDCLVYEKKKQ